MNEIIQLTENTAKAYFDKIFELEKQDNPFPVNIEDVWPLVYSRRDKAISSLRENFIEGVDFLLHQKGKVVNISNLQNGIRIDCFLSVSCLEYFVVRKNRAVFDVYRECRKRIQQPLSSLQILQQSVNQLVQQEKRLTNVEDTVYHN